MLITPDYCRMMARYNAWQNAGIARLVTTLPPDALTADRGAFFGSILGTLNHLLWGDLVWLSRLAGGERPAGAIADSPRLTPTGPAWEALRFRTDGRIALWADGLRALDLHGALTWTSASAGGPVTRDKALCVVHMFNHQTHHRGQVHAMLTAAGLRPPDTDLFLMPEKD